MLFQSYTGCRPAELVHAPRGRGLQDPLDDEKPHDTKPPPDTEETAYDDESDYGDDNDDVMDREDGDFTFDSDDDDDFECDSDGTDYMATEDTAACYISEVNNSGAPVRSSAPMQPTHDPNEFREPVREFKALCYEGICLWIVKDPKGGDRDLLAMEVNLRHHKGADNKPKPCVKLAFIPSPS